MLEIIKYFSITPKLTISTHSPSTIITHIILT